MFLFAGPTGTGKTELAKAVSEFLFGSVERMIRLDMSEFQTHEAISKILGQSSASAIEADSLISRVRKQPFSVVLLDEFEKSHSNIWDLFLQAFDEGRLTDAMGQVADLRHCLIILTSNLGATAHRSMGLGFAPQADEFSKDQVLRAISLTYRPEFRNRLDKIIVFQPLTRDLMRGILKKELAALLERRGLKDRAWAIEWESSALEFLLEKGFSPEMGARPLKRAIDQYLVAPLAAHHRGKAVSRRRAVSVRAQRRRGHSGRIRRSGRGCGGGGSSRRPLAPAVSPALASMILAPEGTQAEFTALQAEYDGIERTLASAEWEELKEQAARRNVVGRFLVTSGSLRHAGAPCADGPGQIGHGNGGCAPHAACQRLAAVAALFRRTQRPPCAATAPDQGRHQGRLRRCADRARAGDRAGVRRRRRSPGDARHGAAS